MAHFLYEQQTQNISFVFYSPWKIIPVKNYKNYSNSRISEEDFFYENTLEFQDNLAVDSTTRTDVVMSCFESGTLWYYYSLDDWLMHANLHAVGVTLSARCIQNRQLENICEETQLPYDILKLLLIFTGEYFFYKGNEETIIK